MPIRKAVIPAAGLGTRFLPASKSVPKELITVVDRPVIQYSVEELVRAGITNICIVTSPGKEAVTDHFSKNSRLEAALERTGKLAELEEITRLYEMAEIYSVNQNEPLGLGHAVWVARDHIDDEPFIVVLPDELFDPAGNCLNDMTAAFEERSMSVTAVTQVPHDSIKAYGSIAPADPADLENGAQLIKVSGVVEKPDPAVAPSDLALIGRYVLSPEIFDVLAKLEAGAGGEIQLADALGVLAGEQKLLAFDYEGRRWDVGTKAGYLEAVVTLGLEHPRLGPGFAKFLAGRDRPEPADQGLGAGA
ncbi:MAG: UTP--glucose-1-phosphate uridylyltransferase [Actinomycetota bacterium]